jgi:hypothetical protein
VIHARAQARAHLRTSVSAERCRSRCAGWLAMPYFFGSVVTAMSTACTVWPVIGLIILELMYSSTG